MAVVKIKVNSFVFVGKNRRKRLILTVKITHSIKNKL